mgnify:CR=1 FL=1
MSDSLRRTRAAVLVVAAALAACGDDPVTPGPGPNPEPGAGYELRVLQGTSHTLALQEVLQLVLVVDRADDGYQGPVSFTADAPAGVVVIFRPTMVLNSNATDILLVADATVEPKRHQVVLRGTAPDRPDRTVTLVLDFTPAT